MSDDSPPGPKHLFTVFTPTYNRAHTLPRVFDSLERQSFRDFEWLIVDDGSSDATGALVEGWQSTSAFDIRYIRQENLGKHVAHNTAVMAARGELFLTLDSDDACVPHALERLAYHWHRIPDAARRGFSAVTVLCMGEHGNIVGDPFPFDEFDANLAEMAYRYKVRGEKWGFQRTDVLREYLFDADSKRGYVPEGLVWHRIGERYRMRFVNEPLRIYFQEGPSLTRERTAAQDAYGRQLYYGEVLERDLRYFRTAPGALLKAAVQYSRYSLHLGLGPVRQVVRLKGLGRVLGAMALPLALVLWLTDRLRG